MASLRKLIANFMLAAVAAVAGADVTIVGDADQPVVRYARSQALLIGVSDYTAGWHDLPSIPGELAQVRSALEAQGFEVETVPAPGGDGPRTVDEDTLRTAIDRFIDLHGYGSENRLLIFFAGHGHTRTVDGVRRGYLVPADAPLPTSGRVEAFLKKAVPMTDVAAWARKIEVRHALFVFDSCFSGTVFDTRSELPEPAHITSLTGKPVRQFLTAGRAGETVPAKSVFTPAFVRALGGAADLTRDGYVTGTELGVYLHQEIAGSGQTPQHGKLPGFREGDFVFRLPFEPPPEAVPFDVSRLKQRLEGEAAWERYQRDMAAAFQQVEDLEELGGTAATKAEAWQSFLAAFDAENPLSDEDEVLRRRAGERLSYWRGRPAMVPVPPAAPRPDRPEAGDPWTEPANGMKFRWVPGGMFKMGSPTTEDGRYDYETQHEVTLSRGFWMGETEVTQGQWRRLMGNNPSGFQSCGDECPVEKVSWFEAVAFANALSKRAGLAPCYEVSGPNDQKAGEGLEYESVRFEGVECRGYRLPTEAEWERGARAGTMSPFSTGSNLTTEQANYDGNYPYSGDTKGLYRQKTVSAGSLAPNPWNLREVHGNVYEWAWDWFEAYSKEAVTDPTGPPDGSHRVIRGGSWISSAGRCRSAYRIRDEPGARIDPVGFRLVRRP